MVLGKFLCGLDLEDIIGGVNCGKLSLKVIDGNGFVRGG